MKDGKLNPDIPRPVAAFGYGRRVCAGLEAAELTLFLSIASMLRTFTFSSDTLKKEEDFGPYGSDLVS